MHSRPGGLAGHSAALIGSTDSAAPSGMTMGVRRACDLSHAEIEGSEPSPGIFHGISRQANRLVASVNRYHGRGHLAFMRSSAVWHCIQELMAGEVGRFWKIHRRDRTIVPCESKVGVERTQYNYISPYLMSADNIWFEYIYFTSTYSSSISKLSHLSEVRL